MAYEKTNWATGDVITAEKLNKIEEGIENVSGGSGGGVMTALITVESPEGGTCDKSYDVILAEITSGKPVIVSAVAGDVCLGSAFVIPDYVGSTVQLVVKIDDVAQFICTLGTTWEIIVSGGGNDSGSNPIK